MNLSKTSAFTGSLGVLALIILGSPAANAALNTGTGFPVVTSSGTNYTYTYTVNLLPGESVINTGVPTTEGGFIFYDFPGYVPFSAAYNNDGTLGALETFTITNALTGPSITGTTPSPPDDPTIQNVLFQYTGPTIVNATPLAMTLGTFSLTTTVGSGTSGPLREFLYQATENTGGTNNGIVNVRYPIAAVPEPGSVAAFAVTGLFLTGLLWRNRRSSAGKTTA